MTIRTTAKIILSREFCSWDSTINLYGEGLWVFAGCNLTGTSEKWHVIDHAPGKGAARVTVYGPLQSWSSQDIPTDLLERCRNLFERHADSIEAYDYYTRREL